MIEATTSETLISTFANLRTSSEFNDSFKGTTGAILWRNIYFREQKAKLNPHISVRVQNTSSENAI